MNSELSEIANALLIEDEKDLTIRKVFFAEDEFSSSDISVHAEGVGSIDFPLTEACIQSLVNISSKAKLELCEETPLNKSVRNANEIKCEKLQVTIEQSSLSRVLDKIRDTLMLEENSILTPHLHNMLICGRGQFFHLPQDTETMDNMIATFVIVLPSSHIGGDLIIHQGDNTHVFSTENINETCAKCIGFYSDCMHDIQEVKHGYHVALTFSLVVNPPQSSPNDIVNLKLKSAVENYFGGEQSEIPRKLVYFFNHEYTADGLNWNMLKGRDRTNACIFSNVACSLNLVPYLASVEIQETFSTCGENSEVESKVTFSYLLDSSNKTMAYDHLDAEDSEICLTKSTSDSFKPYKIEYRFQRNEFDGNDYCYKHFWYRRAALVLWPQSSQTTMDFLLNNRKAMQNLLELTSVPGNKEQIMNIIHKAGKYLFDDEHEYESFIELANIALYLQDENIAYSILSNFSGSIVCVTTAKLLVKLQNEFGIEWCIGLLNKFEKPHYCFIDKIDLFMEIFLQNKGDLQIAELLLDQQSVETDYSSSNHMNLPEKFQNLCQIFKACEIVQNVSILHKIINLVIASPKKYPLIKLVDLFLKLKDEVNSDYYVNFEPLKVFLVSSVNDELALGKHSDNDWSIKVQMPCDCEYCLVAENFLKSKTQVTQRWPLREKLRDHVTNNFRGLCLPINITVDKTSGSPYKLIIEKKESMHQEARERYQELKSCQEKLNRHTFKDKSTAVVNT